METLANVKTIAVDKTGTLTKGTFEVTKINGVNLSNEDLLRIAAYAENYSNHPIANSIKHSFGKNIDGDKVCESHEITGLGLEVLVENHKIYIGNIELMNSKNIDFEEASEIGTIVYIAIDEKYAGYIVISDKIKDEANFAISNLKKENINKTVLLTGDNEKTAKYVADELHIDEHFSKLLPDDKVHKVEELIATSGSNCAKVAFVGDGINDAPVLTRADIGIAMGGLGSDAAIEAADVVIMDDDISKIATAIKISQKTLRIVKQNIFLAIGVKLLVLVLSAFGISNMWQAIFADVGISILAILNSMRMLIINSK